MSKPELFHLFEGLLSKQNEVEIVTKSTLEDYMKKNIWSKLGANLTTFRPELHRDILPPPLEMGYRLSIGHGEKSIKQGPIILGQPAKHNLGGIGLFSTPTDYMKLLSSLLGGGYPLLSEYSIDILFQPQLSEASRMAMPKPLGSQMRRVLGIKCLDDHTQADHCLAGTMTLKDIPGRRRAGTVNWSGLPNLHWVRSLLLYYSFLCFCETWRHSIYLYRILYSNI